MKWWRLDPGMMVPVDSTEKREKREDREKREKREKREERGAERSREEQRGAESSREVQGLCGSFESEVVFVSDFLLILTTDVQIKCSGRLTSCNRHEHYTGSCSVQPLLLLGGAQYKVFLWTLGGGWLMRWSSA